MIAARYEETGPAADVLRVEEIPTPEPGPGEVRVRVAVSGVNPTDFKSRSSAAGAPAGGFQIPNQDGAGTIELCLAGGGHVQLEVECIDATLADVGESWTARGRPEHPLEG